MNFHESFRFAYNKNYLACMVRRLRREWVLRIPWLLEASRSQSEETGTDCEGVARRRS